VCVCVCVCLCGRLSSATRDCARNVDVVRSCADVGVSTYAIGARYWCVQNGPWGNDDGGRGYVDDDQNAYTTPWKP